MTTRCAVLGCESPGDVPLELSPLGEPSLETVVCTEHGAEIENGEHWGWSQEAQAIVIGADLAGPANGPE